MTAPPWPAALPAGFGVQLDPSTRQLTGSVLFGGAPVRAMRLSAAGRQALAELRDGQVRSAAGGLLARRLTDAGLAHPRPPASTAAPAVTVLIPVRDRPAQLDQCLAAVGRAHPVVVVDDGSADPAAVAAITTRHGATLLRRSQSGGPAAARNTGLGGCSGGLAGSDTGVAGIGTELVAFLDSDCVPPPGWIERLAAHLADPLVAAVAPRIVESGDRAGRRSAASRYAAACSSLDLGPAEARVVPATKLAYVPTAALLVRREALEKLSSDGQPVFDPALRYGEDVDLVWRLHDAGWRLRYEPAVLVSHRGPDTWRALLARRFSYGTSAAPLARRHPARLAPLVLQPWPALTVAALLARRPVAATAAATAGWLSLARTVRRAELPADGTAAATLTGIRQTWLGVGRYATQFAAPVLAAGLAAPGPWPSGQRLGRRLAAASLLLGPALDAWQQRESGLDLVRFSLGHIADDVAYGAGVWAGCVRHRTLAPALPAVCWRPFRVPGGRQGKEST
jgi:mycofactocin glycosyltransferase